MFVYCKARVRDDHWAQGARLQRVDQSQQAVLCTSGYDPHWPPEHTPPKIDNRHMYLLRFPQGATLWRQSLSETGAEVTIRAEIATASRHSVWHETVTLVELAARNNELHFAISARTSGTSSGPKP
jgi:hypothetical protein